MVLVSIKKPTIHGAYCTPVRNQLPLIPSSNILKVERTVDYAAFFKSLSHKVYDTKTFCIGFYQDMFCAMVKLLFSSYNKSATANGSKGANGITIR